ncbi:MAG: ArsA family ATPase [Acidimicrobiales bacterium]
MLDRRLLFVTGKGGVGKTSVAAGLAVLASGQGKRVLICDVDGEGDLRLAFESPPLSFAPQSVGPNLFAMAMSTEEALKEYLRVHLRVPFAGRLGPVARSFDFVASAAPGVREILTVGKLAHEVRERSYDLVVVDAPATGHVVGQLAAPKAIHDLVKVGLVREQTQWMLDILRDPDTTGTVIVATPEEMPVAETLQLAKSLESETDVHLAAVVVNRVLPEPFSMAEEVAFASLAEDDAMRVITAAAGDGIGTVLQGVQTAVDMRRSRAPHIARLRRELPSETPLLFLPEIFGRTKGIRTTRKIAEALEEEL